MSYDPEPQPTDGPDYHAEHAAWRARADRALVVGNDRLRLADMTIQRNEALIQRAQALAAARQLEIIAVTQAALIDRLLRGDS